MRKLPVFVLALMLAVATIGCDSEEDLTDAEIFVGSWTVVEVNDNEGDKTNAFQQGINAFSATLEADGDYQLLIDFVDPQQPDRNFNNTYELVEATNDLRLNAVLPTGPVLISFTYNIESEDRIHLSINEQFVQAIFGADPDTYAGTVVFTIERV